jgi:MFS family permease
LRVNFKLIPLESLGYIVSIPAERAFVADIAGWDIRGMSYGLYSFSFFPGAALGPLLGSWMYDRVEKVVLFFLNALVLIIGALLVFFFLREPDSTIESAAQPPDLAR